jgi:2'-hydroxyisoflavone reductase
VRLARGDDVLAPDDPAAPVQFIDARDLARWIIALVERDVGGVFNATGPAQRLRFDDFLSTAARALGAACRFVWVEAGFLQRHAVQPWTELPLWITDAPGLNQADIRRAIDAGLSFSPLEGTVADTHAWAQCEIQARGPESLGTAGLAAEREAAVLAAWDSRTR